MAEFDIDDLLRDSFARQAEPGDSAGVADAIRSRVAAGDPGTSVAGSTAPGWSGAAGLLGWLPWVGLVAVVGATGVGLGAAGVLAPEQEAPIASPYRVLQVTTPGYDCPEGPVVTRLGANERVVAVARDDDGAWVAVRDPRDLATEVWVPLSVVTVDSGEPDIASLPVGAGCPEEVPYEVEQPEPVAPPAGDPQQPSGPNNPGAPNNPPPPPPGDTTAPSVTQVGASPNPVYATEPVSLSAVATDNVGVTSVVVSWSGQYSGSTSMTPSGGQWVATFVPPTNNSGTITFTFRAYDAAGNASGAPSTSISHQYFG